MVTEIHSFSARWRNRFSRTFNVHGFSDVMQTEINTAEPPAPEERASEFEMAIEKLKRLTSPYFDKIPAEISKAGA